MGKVALRISDLPNAAASASRKQLAFSRLDGNELLVESGLPPTALLNDHLVAIWGHLKHQRRYLKSLQVEGAVFQIDVPARDLPVVLKSNGAAVLHLLGITLTVGRA